MIQGVVQISSDLMNAANRNTAFDLSIELFNYVTTWQHNGFDFEEYLQMQTL